HGGWRHARIEFDGQTEDRDDPRQHGNDRDHPGEYRALNEKSRHDIVPGQSLADCVPLMGFTCMPGAVFWKPCRRMRSPSLRPCCSIHWSPTARSAVIGTEFTVLSAPNFHTISPPSGLRMAARCGTVIVRWLPSCRLACTNRPGNRIRSGLGNRARSCTEPVL